MLRDAIIEPSAATPGQPVECGSPGRPLWRRNAGKILALGITVLLVAAVVTGGRTLQRSGFRLITIHGGSMGDTVPIGSVVLVKWSAPTDVKVGDIILVQTENNGAKDTPRLHRVISLDQGTDGLITVQTKGDANGSPDPDPFLLSGDVLVYRYHLPRIGYWMSFVQTPVGWLLVVALPFTLAALSILVSVWLRDKQRAV